MEYIAEVQKITDFGMLDRYAKNNIWYTHEQLFQAINEKCEELYATKPWPKFRFGSEQFDLAVSSRWDFTHVANSF